LSSLPTGRNSGTSSRAISSAAECRQSKSST
jgi:hypothetical protein